MSDHSDIQWTDATWNPTTGCTKISPGCAHCYIERTVPFRTKHRAFVDGHIPLTLHEGRLEQPLRWRKPKRVFVNSLSDLFHPDVPDRFIDRVFAVMALAPQHTFQVLTKRAERMRAYMHADGLRRRIAIAAVMLDGSGRDAALDAMSRRILWGDPRPNDGALQPVDVKPWPVPNVWLGVSVENQHFADARIPLLLQTPAAVRFISAEPLLGPVDLRDAWLPSQIRMRYLREYDIVPDPTSPAPRQHLDWVIVGGESGKDARPSDVTWAASMIAQCRAAGVACFVKQLGACATLTVDVDTPDGRRRGVGRLALRDKKGGDPAEWPADLRVREFPTTESLPRGGTHAR